MSNPHWFSTHGSALDGLVKSFHHEPVIMVWMNLLNIDTMVGFLEETEEGEIIERLNLQTIFDEDDIDAYLDIILSSTLQQVVKPS